MRPHHIDLIALFEDDWTPAKSIQMDARERLGLPESTCRGHLHRLKGLGIIEARQTGRVVDYRITEAGELAIEQYGEERCAS